MNAAVLAAGLDPGKPIFVIWEGRQSVLNSGLRVMRTCVMRHKEHQSPTSPNAFDTDDAGNTMYLPAHRARGVLRSLVDTFPKATVYYDYFVEPYARVSQIVVGQGMRQLFAPTACFQIPPAAFVSHRRRPPSTWTLITLLSIASAAPIGCGSVGCGFDILAMLFFCWGGRGEGVFVG